jgi:hypothetical protein
MFCYKDRTFCPFDKCSKFNTCKTALTEGVQKDAERWMKDPPICVYVDKPDCYKGGIND